MTKEEAIAKLKWYLNSNTIEDISGNEGIEEAISMAIEALSNTSNTLNALDCISRRAAVDALIEWYGCKPNDIEAFEEIIEALPPAQPEQKTGKWKGYNADNQNWLRTDGSPVFLICSECGQVVVNNFSAHWNYCSNCGARMEVER